MLRICFENSELRVFEAHLVTRDEGVIVERSGDVTRFTLEVDWSLSRFKGADEVTLEKLTKGSVTYPAFPRFPEKCNSIVSESKRTELLIAIPPSGGFRNAVKVCSLLTIASLILFTVALSRGVIYALERAFFSAPRLGRT